jgi:hypothetical protein
MGTLPGLALLLAFGAQDVDAGKRVATLPAEGGAEASLEAEVRAALAAIEELEAISRDNTLAEMESAEQLGVTCDIDDERCLARLTVVLRADFLVVPRTSGSGVHLDLYDATIETRVRTVWVVDSATAELGGAVGQLLFPSRFTGQLLVRTAAGAQVTLDDGQRGQGPTARFETTPAGAREVTVRRGEAEVRQVVEVVAGESVEVDVPIAAPVVTGGAQEAPASDDTLLFAGIGVAAVGGALVAGGVATVIAMEVVLGDETSPVVDRQARQAYWYAELGGAIAAATGVAVALTGGVLLYLSSADE